MGKKIEDLKLDDTPISDEPTDVRATPWFTFIGEIDELIDSEQYAFAEDTLRGIRDTVERTRRVTEGQRVAITNIAASKTLTRHVRRRYEGWQR